MAAKYAIDNPDRELLDWLPRDAETDVVLYFLPDNDYTPYVTWVVRRDAPTNTFWGHYFKTLEEGRQSLKKRAKFQSDGRSS